MAPVEYAWTSFSGNAVACEFFSSDNSGTADRRFHPTQKPVALYEWLYSRFARNGYKILDTHLGSGSSRIAAKHMGLYFVGCEIDETYFMLQEERWERENAQVTIALEPPPLSEQQSMNFD